MISDATRRQNAASHPETSTWVSANAGSGKTRVLTDRVARLLLAGQAPQKILCITYTKAAAAEMQNRLFARLGEWAMMPDEDLREALTGIGERGQHYSVERLAETRTYFARALETPGGLKIQTIHAFCASLLRRFPLEAGVSPQFREIDEAQTSELRSQILSDMAQEERPDHLDGLARHLTDEGSLGNLLSEILKHSERFSSFDRSQAAGALGAPIDRSESQIIDDAMAQVRSKVSTALLSHMLAQEEKSYEHKCAAALAGALEPGASNPFASVTQGFLTKDRRPRARGLPSAHTKEKFSALADTLNDLKAIVFNANCQIDALRLLDRTEALHRFAQVFVSRYAQAKSERNCLDFDDLISRTRALLADARTTAWVLFKLDSGIEHVLIDEAQDTSPAQWEIIEKLTEEFTAGQSASETNRTVFVVGDKKQSIFGFQGADPEKFVDQQAYFQSRFAAVQKPFEPIDLPTSFRSAAPILKLVDTVFQGDISALGGTPHHIALVETPGRVDLWPFIPNEPKPKDPEWWELKDTNTRVDPVQALAGQVAEEIALAIEEARRIYTKDGGRPSRPGDFLILVRTRDRFFHMVINQLKSLGVPVAGADRLRVLEELAVRDLVSVLKFIDNENDDLSLAEALRSPLFGLSEQELFTLAHDRPGTLWAALQNSTHHEAIRWLQDLRRISGFQRPFEVLSTILTTQGGRSRLLARLGSECEDAIDELLSQSLLFERNRTPTLSGFLTWLTAQDITIKRDMDAGRNEVRVMTVHGAKGLEAPVVILPDVSNPNNSLSPLEEVEGQLIWIGTKDDSPVLHAQISERRKAIEQAEWSRLLYVALTRAENRLIVCGAGKETSSEVRWHKRVRDAMQDMEHCETTDGIMTLRHKWSGPCQLEENTPETTLSRPSWIDTPPAQSVGSDGPLSPSELGGSHALPGEPSGDGRARGNAIHTLLEVLPLHPQENWAQIAQQVLRGEALAPEYLEEATQLLAAPHLRHLFSEQGLSEAPLTAEIPELGGRRIFGRIDRLVLSEGKVICVDFKTNALVPETAQDVPDGILAQQGAYLRALEQIYPDRQIETAILWTRSAKLMTLPHHLVITALRNVSVA